jgi:hypothetical protein
MEFRRLLKYLLLIAIVNLFVVMFLSIQSRNELSLLQKSRGDLSSKLQNASDKYGIIFKSALIIQQTTFKSPSPFFPNLDSEYTFKNNYFIYGSGDSQIKIDFKEGECSGTMGVSNVTVWTPRNEEELIFDKYLFIVSGHVSYTRCNNKYDSFNFISFTSYDVTRTFYDNNHVKNRIFLHGIIHEGDQEKGKYKVYFFQHSTNALMGNAEVY